MDDSKSSCSDYDADEDSTLYNSETGKKKAIRPTIGGKSPRSSVLDKINEDVHYADSEKTDEE